MHRGRRTIGGGVALNNDADACVLARSYEIAHSNERLLTSGARAVDTTEAQNSVAELETGMIRRRIARHCIDTSERSQRRRR